METEARTETLAVKFSQVELQKIDRLWKDTDDLRNRSQFVRAAINSYAGKAICTVD